MRLTQPERKRRKKEEKRREGRYSNSFPRGDMKRYRLQSSQSPWWELLDHADVYDEWSATGRR